MEASEKSALNLLARLKEHRTLQDVPEKELEWLAAHGRRRTLMPGDQILPPDRRVDELWILLWGHVTIYVDRGAGPRRTMDWWGGDLAGVLPYSRLTHAPGMPLVEEPAETVMIHRDCFPEMMRECPTVTAKCVQVMLDRARIFTQQDLHDEKMLSLGRLSAGLAHELDNPAAAVMRSAKLLGAVVDDAERAAIALGAGHLPEEQMASIRALRDSCMVTRAQAIRSPLEQARHEEVITDWLDDHNIQVAAAELLADTPITLEMLDALERAVDPGVLEPAIRWVASACALRTIVAETGEAASRISELVKAVRAYTHRDEGAPRLVDIQQSLTETLAVLRSKAKGKSARVRVDAEAGLPRVTAIGGELNQVWSNLLDNALDAIPQGGCVEVSARKEGASVVVRVVDDGPGIQPENRERVFEPFFTTKPVGQGTGQGLDIVRRLVARQRGLVELISVPGRTEFRVTLPVAEPPAAASTGAPAASPAADDSGNGSTETTVAGTTPEAASPSTDPEVRA